MYQIALYDYNAWTIWFLIFEIRNFLCAENYIRVCRVVPKNENVPDN